MVVMVFLTCNPYIILCFTREREGDTVAMADIPYSRYLKANITIYSDKQITFFKLLIPTIKSFSLRKSYI